MNYPETTLDQFKNAAEGHVAGRKTGVTMVYKGLSGIDKGYARRWMLANQSLVTTRLRPARMHLNVERIKQLEGERNAWVQLCQRLSEV